MFTTARALERADADDSAHASSDAVIGSVRTKERQVDRNIARQIDGFWSVRQVQIVVLACKAG